MASLEELKNVKFAWSIRLDRALIASRLGWISSEDLNMIENEIFEHVFGQKISEPTRQLLCSYSIKKDDEIAVRIPLSLKLHQENPNSWKAMACLRVDGFQQNALEIYRTTSMGGLKDSVLTYLSMVRYQDPSFAREILDLYRNGSRVQRDTAFVVLTHIRSSIPEVREYFGREFLRSTDSSFRRRALRAIGGEIDDPAIKSAILTDLEKVRDDVLYLQDLARSVLRFDSITEAERARVRRVLNRNPTVRGIIGW